MQVHFIPVSRGVSKEEVTQRMQVGWLYFGRQSVQGPAIANVNKPGAPVGVEDFDIWVLPEPTIPLSVLGQMLVEIHTKQSDPALALDDLARAVFGMGIVPLAEAVTSAAEGDSDKEE